MFVHVNKAGKEHHMAESNLANDDACNEKDRYDDVVMNVLSPSPKGNIQALDIGNVMTKAEKLLLKLELLK